ncbi:MAG: hypothetical protein ACI8ZN_002000 [Bacteroidia bacterium]
MCKGLIFLLFVKIKMWTSKRIDEHLFIERFKLTFLLGLIIYKLRFGIAFLNDFYEVDCCCQVEMRNLLFNKAA